MGDEDRNWKLVWKSVFFSPCIAKRKRGVLNLNLYLHLNLRLYLSFNFGAVPTCDQRRVTFRPFDL